MPGTYRRSGGHAVAHNAPLCYLLVMDITIRNLDGEAYRRIKARAALEGLTLGEAVSEAIRRHLEAVGPERPSGEVREAGPAYRVAGPSLPASAEERRRSLERLLAEEIWPRVPGDLLGKGIGKPEREEILGLDEEE